MATGIYFAIDPGRSSGFAMRLPSGLYHTATYTKHQDIWSLIYQHKPDHVACEEFARNERIDANMIFTIELVGSIKSLCFVLKLNYHGQQNQVRRSFIPDAIDILEKQGRHVVNTKEQDNHEIDALAHLLYMEYKLSQ